MGASLLPPTKVCDDKVLWCSRIWDSLEQVSEVWLGFGCCPSLDWDSFTFLAGGLLVTLTLFLPCVCKLFFAVLGLAFSSLFADELFWDLFVFCLDTALIFDATVICLLPELTNLEFFWWLLSLLKPVFLVSFSFSALFLACFCFSSSWLLPASLEEYRLLPSAISLRT